MDEKLAVVVVSGFKWLCVRVATICGRGLGVVALKRMRKFCVVSMMCGCKPALMGY